MDRSAAWIDDAYAWGLDCGQRRYHVRRMADYHRRRHIELERERDRREWQRTMALVAVLLVLAVGVVVLLAGGGR